MVPDWIVQALFTNILWVILAAAVGAILGYLKLSGSQLVLPALYGLVGALLLAMIILALRLPSLIIDRHEGDVRPENVEEYIRKWADEYELSIKRNNDPAAFFSYYVTMPNGTAVTIARERRLPKYLMVGLGIVLNQHDEMFLEMMPPLRQRGLNSEIMVELSRMKLQYSGLMLPLRRMTIERRIPVVPQLTGESLFNAVGEVLSANTIVIETISRTIATSTPVTQ